MLRGRGPPKKTKKRPLTRRFSMPNMIGRPECRTMELIKEESGNRKWCRQTGSRQSTPLSTIRTRYRKFSIDSGSHTAWQNPAEFSPKVKPIRNFSIDPTSSIRTSIADAIFADAISETPKEIPRRTSLVPLASPCFVLCLVGFEREGFRLPGEGGIVSIVR